MLKLYNKEHEAISALTNLKDYKVEYTLSGEDLLEFSLSICDENIHLVEEEGYVRNKNNEYVIKAIEYSDNFKRFTCDVNVEDLVGKAISSFDTSNNNINDTIRLAIAGTGWILADNNITKRRTVRLTNTNALEVLREVRKVFSVDFRYDAINKIIHVYEKFGEDRGVYFSDELNLKSFSIPSDTYDYVTRLYPYGKDGLNISSINNGKEYIENFQYSNKVIELIWEDNRYTVAENLLEDAKAKLDELSKPKRSYQASIVDLAKQSEEYSYLDFFLGDTITLLSKQEKFRDKQRIVKYIEYPDDPSQNTCELGNTTLTFEELQKENEAKNNTVDAITSDNGTVDGSKVDNITTEQISDFEASVAKITDLTAVNAEIENLKAQDVTITGKLSAVEGEFGTLKANVGTIDKLTVTHTAQINNLEANKADITELNAVRGEITLLESEVAKIGTLESDVADIEHVLAGNITSDNIASGTITADKMATGTITAGSGVIANGAIGNAQISSLSANKIDTGEIDTSKVKVKGKDGFLLIENNTLYVTDNNRQIRVELGQIENNTNYGFVVRGADGQTVLLDHNGVRNAGITDGAIDNRTVSESANISGKKLDIDSVIKTINEDGSVKIQGTIVQVGNTTLDVKLSEQNNLITEQGKKLETQQAEITANTNAIKLKVDNQTYQTDKTNMTTQMNKNTSEISAMKGEIALKVEQSDITNAIDNLEIGGRNLISQSDKFNKGSGSTGISGVVNSDGTLSVTSVSGNGNWYTGWAKSNGITEQNMNEGDIFTISFTMKSSNTTSKPSIYIKSGMGYYSMKGTMSNNWSTIYYTGTWKKNNNMDLHLGFGGVVGTIDIKNWKIEKGNKPTDWTPAPEDITSEIENKVSTAKAEIKVTTDAISQNVSNLTQTVSTKADGSTVSSLNSKVGSLETSVNGISGKVTNLEKTTTNLGTSVEGVQGEISTLKSDVASLEVTTGGISQKVSSVESTTSTLTTQMSQVDGKINTAKSEAITGARTIPDTRNTNENPQWYITNYPRQTITEFKFANVIGIGSSSVYGTLETKVPWDNYTGGYPVQTFRSNSTATYERKGTSTTAWSTWKQIEDTSGSQAKATQALTDAKEFTTIEVTKTNNKVAEIVTDLNGITQRVQSTESTVSTHTTQLGTVDSRINTAVNNIQVGGRNLLKNSKSIYLTGSDYSAASKRENGKITVLTSGDFNAYTWVQNNLSTTLSDLTPTTGKKFSMSVDIKTTNLKHDNIQVTFDFRGSGKTMSIGRVNLDKSKNGIWYRLSATFTTVDTKYPTCLLNITSNGNNADYSGLIIEYKNWKIEEGNKATDWTPAPEDVDSAITTVDSKVTTTNNKVAAIETNLSSITSRVSNVENTTTTINGNITNLQSRMNSAEQKITDDAITNTVKQNFYTKSETEGAITSKGYQTESQVQQKVDSFEVKIGSSGGYNELLNSNFNAELLNWVKYNSPSVNFNPNVSTSFGKVIAITGNVTGQDSGIYQIFSTIPGNVYTCSFYAEPHGVTNVSTAIGIDGVNVINIAYNSFRRYSFTFTATSTTHAFVAYSKLKNGTFYLGRPMVSSGEILYEYSPNPNEVLSTTAQFTVDGMTISSAKAGVKTNISTDGMNITRTSDGKSLLKATSKGVRAEGGMFYVEDNQNGYTYFWGRDIVINDQRALVGTNSNPESPLLANKLYVNYNNDFKNGVEIGGMLTNGGRPILSQYHYDSFDTGILTLSNGFIIQWGKIGNLSIEGGEMLSRNLTFPIAFNNKCFFASVNINSVDDGNGDLETRYNAWLKHTDKNGAILKVRNYTDQKWGSKMEIYWFAIGS